MFLSPCAFTPTAEVVRHLRATSAFVDVGPLTLDIDPKALEVTLMALLDRSPGRPNAIMPAHPRCPDVDAIWTSSPTRNQDFIEILPSVQLSTRTHGGIQSGRLSPVSPSMEPGRTLTTEEKRGC